MQVKNMLKGIGAVVAGFLTVAVLSIVTDMILESTGIFPPSTEPMATTPLMLAFALLYRSIYSILGGYITAWLAPFRPMQHVVILGVFGTIGGILGVIAGWQFGNHWYPIALAVTAFPLVWLGGKLRKN